MARRIACLGLDGGERLSSFLGLGLGEDWPVPRAPVAWLVVRELPEGAQLCAWSEEGHLIGDVPGGSFDDLRRVLEEGAARGLLGPWREIPAGTDGVLELLRAT